MINFFMCLLNELEERRHKEVDDFSVLYVTIEIQPFLHTLAANCQKTAPKEGFVYHHILL